MLLIVNIGIFFCFNTQPPKGGWPHDATRILRSQRVSTHSRLKAAGERKSFTRRPCAGFNTQPPKGGWASNATYSGASVGFNTQPPKGGWFRKGDIPTAATQFQHTAA